MTPHRISVKLFLKDAATPDVEALISVFHRWIREGVLEGLSVDVADYAHVPEGPGVMLIGHETDCGLDSEHGRPGLLTVRKRLNAGDLKSNLAEALRLANAAADKLEAESLPQPWAFDRSQVEVKLQDRLRVENSDAGFEAVKADVTEALGATDVRRVSDDSRQALTVAATLGAAV